MVPIRLIAVHLLQGEFSEIVARRMQFSWRAAWRERSRRSTGGKLTRPGRAMRLCAGWFARWLGSSPWEIRPAFSGPQQRTWAAQGAAARV